MARTSRKHLNSQACTSTFEFIKNQSTEHQSTENQSTTRIIAKLYHAAIYVRLSTTDNGKENSDSIENQIDLLKRYIKDRPSLQLEMVYSDNGFSGTNFCRPEWNQLMEAVKAGKINCIIVKDLSRLGRDYIETGDYLDTIFPLLKVRFIAVNDHYDSEDLNCYRESFSIALKNLVNDFYAKDISKKVSSSSKEKQKRGEYQGAHPPYGYLFSEEGTHKLIIDKEAAEVVKEIYKLILEGNSDSNIAQRLNGRGISAPRGHYYKLGLIHSIRYAEHTQWYSSAIKRIGENQIYIGCMVRGKSKESLYDNMSRHKTAESEWIIVSNTQEAILSEEVFQKVQSIRKERYNSQQYNKRTE